ncbi:MAG TPA: lytic transglycosylase domain-containing protein [Nocardioidaceae bacterium]|nr:lytic transglycosylase domain-containing protein [Nocardioidaceae bacterium]
MSAAGVTGAVALLGTAGVAVGVGVASAGSEVASQPTGSGALVAAAGTHVPTVDALLARRRLAVATDRASRSTTRPGLTADTKAAPPAVEAQGVSGSVTVNVAPTDPRALARWLLPSYGWDEGQFACLDAIWDRESGWSPYARNPYSGAYGIPQALPGSKMAIYGANWESDAATQIRWGLAYIKSSYGSPCSAWDFWQTHGSY